MIEAWVNAEPAAKNPYRETNTLSIAKPASLLADISRFHALGMIRVIKTTKVVVGRIYNT
jgi:hypothetical protein